MAIVERDFVKDVDHHPARAGDVILGDDWVSPTTDAPAEFSVRRKRRGLLSLRSSPLARKIITFNLIALAVLVAGILYSNSAQNSLAVQRAAAIVTEANLIADLIEVQLPQNTPVNLATGDGVDINATLERINLHSGAELFVFDNNGSVMATIKGGNGATSSDADSRTILTDGLGRLWDLVAAPLSSGGRQDAPTQDQLKAMVEKASPNGSGFSARLDSEGGTLFSAGAPISQNGSLIGMVALTSATGEIDSLARAQLERVLQMFLIATIVSIVLSLVLASTIANPLADLSSAAELGRDKNSRKVNPGRVRIPDLTARPDEIGRLSGALRSMVAALYTRIEGNEQFAADVAHEIKNPLASLRSAVGTLRMIKREDHRAKLLDVIEHDVRRLDRLVSDISNASRLDAELVKEEEEAFDLLTMLGNLGQYLGEDARGKGIDFILDLPKDPVDVLGLEARLAQVFVNLITNAISFCEDGDAIRVWARKRQNRVLVVVEDTGPGIPDQALGKIFKRFYSERPAEHFGNNSGLGLAISKQIVEAHGGVIWAENIRPTDADITSEPLGARFVVGLPV
ncbi:MAG: sensor histidine kinase [Aliishimia sp.]